MSFIGLSIMLMTLGSCGSDNKVAVTPAPDTAETSESTATTSNGTDSCQSSSSYADFRSRVASMNFLKNSTTKETYYYYECEEKDGWFGINYDSCRVGNKIRSINTDTGFMRHEGGNTREAVRDHLLSLIDNAVDASGGGSYYDIEASTGELFRIDLCKPIVANPTIWLSADEEESYRFYGKTSY